MTSKGYLIKDKSHAQVGPGEIIKPRQPGTYNPVAVVNLGSWISDTR